MKHTLEDGVELIESQPKYEPPVGEMVRGVQVMVNHDGVTKTAGRLGRSEGWVKDCLAIAELPFSIQHNEDFSWLDLRQLAMIQRKGYTIELRKC